jgi:lipopolysaccharide/colanic/teichoic acid biosynthesis glycosyltransferase
LISRLFDIFVSLFTIIILLPLLLIASVFIVVDSGFPILFRQTRVGRFGIEFAVLKFRTMRESSDSTSAEFQPGSRVRVTKVGKVLRKTKIDEIPQLWNILFGQMSIVGPRPEVPKWVETMPELFESVLKVRPGLTDPASIVYRYEEELLAAAKDPNEEYKNNILPKKLCLSTKYIENRTMLMDIKVIVATIFVLFGISHSWSNINR